ncbi:hypothetical protein ACI3LY_003716 [Candidozyma auris]|uniref:Uncharacterized protein n=1 Tax=Candidozyma auris TaxID=498019 RepID=A0A2H1A0Z1_CANAR|nr:hypothetical_protein [[Candida] auris]KNE02334.2 hypothetical protein QG37_00591 [[Candida] auris]PIS56274.1 hypothetical protein CJI97_001522 [[Candida] auris]PIS56548.1 hypothetical protein B9J08_001084 [[Candida] auris]QEO22075.1 hypothetical_protein [[Candida] auris]GBL51516.1 hypothetical protein CAJCM15448_37900 [[Candida] auris]
MSYSQLPQQPQSQPPAYETTGPTSPYGEPPGARTEGDNIPDDFKYSVNVASCELPIRQMFIRKVYAILSLQIFATIAVGFFIRSSSGVQNWCMNNMWLFWVSMVGSFGFMIAAHVKARSYPTNLILLAGFTLCEAYLVGLGCSLDRSEILVKATLLTAIIFIGLTAFAFQTKYDFRSWQGALGMGLWALLGWGLMMMFFPGGKTVNMVYSGIGALLFCGYIVVDTQLIMKSYHLDDEVLAAIKLYLDILNLFLFILRMMRNSDD